MMNYAETTCSSTIVPFISAPCSQDQEHGTEPLPAMGQQPGKETGQGTMIFRKAVIVTNNADGFLVGIECGQVCYIEEDHPVTSTVLADLFAEIVDPDDDLPEDYPVGFIVGFLDAMLRDRKTYPPGWFRSEERA